MWSNCIVILYPHAHIFTFHILFEYVKFAPTNFPNQVIVPKIVGWRDVLPNTWPKTREIASHPPLLRTLTRCSVNTSTGPSDGDSLPPWVLGITAKWIGPAARSISRPRNSGRPTQTDRCQPEMTSSNVRSSHPLPINHLRTNGSRMTLPNFTHQARSCQ